MEANEGNLPAGEQGLGEEARAHLRRVLEALLLAADEPLGIDRLQRLLGERLGVERAAIRAALAELGEQLADRAVALQEVAGGWRIVVRERYAELVGALWQERPPRLSRALLETLALIIYRQPITRGEIEQIRGVSTSPNIIRTLFERGWIREVGVREVPGRPALLGTTTQLLNDLNLKSLDQLPPLPEIKDPEQLEAALERLGARREAERLQQAVAELAAEQQTEGPEDGDLAQPAADAAGDLPEAARDRGRS